MRYTDLTLLASALSVSLASPLAARNPARINGFNVNYIEKPDEANGIIYRRSPGEWIERQGSNEAFYYVEQIRNETSVSMCNDEFGNCVMIDLDDGKILRKPAGAADYDTAKYEKFHPESALDVVPVNGYTVGYITFKPTSSSTVSLPIIQTKASAARDGPARWMETTKFKFVEVERTMAYAALHDEGRGYDLRLELERMQVLGKHTVGQPQYAVLYQIDQVYL